MEDTIPDDWGIHPRLHVSTSAHDDLVPLPDLDALVSWIEGMLPGSTSRISAVDGSRALTAVRASSGAWQMRGPGGTVLGPMDTTTRQVEVWGQSVVLVPADAWRRDPHEVATTIWDHLVSRVDEVREVQTVQGVGRDHFTSQPDPVLVDSILGSTNVEGPTELARVLGAIPLGDVVWVIGETGGLVVWRDPASHRWIAQPDDDAHMWVIRDTPAHDGTRMLVPTRPEMGSVRVPSVCWLETPDLAQRAWDWVTENARRWVSTPE